MGFIKMPNGYCSVCNDNVLKPVIGKREKALCVNHWKIRHQKSDTRREEDVIYAELRKEHLDEFPECQLAVPGVCEFRAVEIHHSEGHGGKYLDKSTYRSACRACHEFERANPTYAYENNLSKRRLIKF